MEGEKRSGAAERVTKHGDFGLGGPKDGESVVISAEGVNNSENIATADGLGFHRNGGRGIRDIGQ